MFWRVLINAALRPASFLHYISFRMVLVGVMISSVSFLHFRLPPPFPGGSPGTLVA